MYAVIGANGQVGHEFARALSPSQALFLTHKQIEVTDVASVQASLGRVSCSAVIILAAFHDVNACEADPERAFRVNATGAANIAKIATSIGSRVVYFSTDYVFGQDSDRRSPYAESDSTGPLNVYGRSKATGEQLVRAACANHLIIRTSSIFGAVTSRKGWTFPEMVLRRARAREPLRIVNDQVMSPTYAPDLVRCVIQLIDAGITGTVHVSNAGGCTWYDFASSALRMAGIEGEVEPVSSDAFPSLARRPAYSVLVSERVGACNIAPMRHWREALEAYLIESADIIQM
jgi:dTDP-4-dehydrorhamnose reductase